MTTADQLAIVSKLLQPQEEAHTIAQVSFGIALSSIVKAFLHFSCNPEFLLKSDFNKLFHNTCIFWKHANLSTTFTFSWPFVVYSDHTILYIHFELLVTHEISSLSLSWVAVLHKESSLHSAVSVIDSCKVVTAAVRSLVITILIHRNVETFVQSE